MGLMVIDMVLTMFTIAKYGFDYEANIALRYLTYNLGMVGIFGWYLAWALIYYNIFLFCEYVNIQTRFKIKHKEDLSVLILVGLIGIYIIGFATHIILYIL